MNFYFSENLKRLRKERDLTQETLADYIGVSSQAVSKWERGESYPNIELLPNLASLLDVTIDELLGTDNSIKKEKIKSYIEIYDDMSIKDILAVLKIYKNAIKEFPNEYSLLIRYMELLQSTRNHSDAVLDSVEFCRLYKRIQKHCTDDEIRIRSKRLMIENLMWQYDTLGLDEQIKKQAESIITTLPKLEDTKEIAITKTANADNWYELFGKEIEELTYILQNAIISYCYYSTEFTTEYKINTIKHINGIIKMLDTDETPTKNRLHLIYNYGHLGHLYYEKGNKEEALRYLKLAAEQAADFDLIPESEQILTYYEQEERFRNMSMRERMKELFIKHYPFSDAFKEAQEFQEIIKIME